jgi:hypothetical protein
VPEEAVAAAANTTRSRQGKRGRKQWQWLQLTQH